MRTKTYLYKIQRTPKNPELQFTSEWQILLTINFLTNKFPCNSRARVNHAKKLGYFQPEWLIQCFILLLHIKEQSSIFWFSI